MLINKYYFDWYIEHILAPSDHRLGLPLSAVGDQRIIDGALVNGSAHVVAQMAGIVRRIQSGYLYHYAFAMIIGLAVVIGWLVLEI